MSRIARVTEQFVVRLTPEDARRLDAMMIAGKYSSRADLVGSLIRAILDDDEAEGRTPNEAVRVLQFGRD
jgi:Arc/MetJ-type ribon-helix-helix transcriptional regulator